MQTETLDSKKYVITGLIGLLLVGIAAFFLMSKNRLPERITSPVVIGNQNLFSIAPSSYDQFVYIESDENLKKAITQYSPVEGLSGNFQVLLEQVDAALVMQYGSGDKIYNLLFLQGQKIDIETLQKLGIVATGEGFETQKLQSNIWVYGAADSLAWRELEKDTLLNDPTSRKYRKEFHDGKYNIGFLSKPLGGINSSPLVNQFSEKLENTSVMTHLDLEKTYGKLTLQFTDDVISSSGKDFAPKFSEYLGTGNVFFLEMGDILGFMGITKEKFMSLAPNLVKKDSDVYGHLLGIEDYEKVYDIFHKQIGIVVEPYLESPVGFSLYLLFDDIRAFDILKKLSPLWKKTFSGFSGSGSVIEEITENTIDYKIASPSLGTGKNISASISTKENMTIFSLFGKTLEKKSVQKELFYTDDTVLAFQIDSKQLQKLGGPLRIVDEVNALGQGIISGNIESDEKKNQMIINFKIQK